jgi:hypothetical protein
MASTVDRTNQGGACAGMAVPPIQPETITTTHPKAPECENRAEPHTSVPLGRLEGGEEGEKRWRQLCRRRRAAENPGLTTAAPLTGTMPRGHEEFFAPLNYIPQFSAKLSPLRTMVAR